MKLKIYQYFGILFLLCATNVFSQVTVPFSSRLSAGSVKIKGDLTMIGNNILGPASVSNTAEANIPFTGTGNNNGRNLEYIDIDGDPTTFSSSSSNLNINGNCKQIVFAGLYWSATYPYDRSTASNSNIIGTPRLSTFNEIKLKIPGSSTYVNLVADNNPDPVGEEDRIIFDGYNASNPAASTVLAPYACYKNITNLVKTLADPNGTYVVADLIASKGINDGGSCGGWTIVIVYEDPNLTSKYINIFDGFAGVRNTTAVDFTVNGFNTLPAPLPVKARIGVVALEGDLDLTGDNLSFKANANPTFTTLSNALNPANNFFSSTISINDINVSTRNPASTNTLGFDQDIIQIDNPGNTIIPNNETGGTYRISTSGDTYYVYLTTFAVEIIEPKILLTKTVQDNLGNTVAGNVVLGQELNYVIGFQNTGNDAASSFTVRDVLPDNINFTYPTDLTLPPGVTSTYNAASRTLVFTIPNTLVEVNDPRYEIRIRVKIVETCYQLSSACSNIIRNQAFATYRGVLNTSLVSDDPSFSTFGACVQGVPSTTNFLVGIDNCDFKRTEILCGTSLTLTAAAGYTSYSWSTSPTGTPVIGTSSALIVTSPGTYYVTTTIPAPCISIKETVTVVNFGTTANPVIPFADEVVICPNDGKSLPNIFLCGINDSQLIQTNINNVISISWQKLNESSCPPAGNVNCANENAACTWNQVSTGTNFLANTLGKYRMVINYQGGCVNTFYFNVYQNTLAPVAIVRDIICNTPGRITINNVPSGYEYSFTTASVPGIFGPSNTFTTTTVGVYNVFIRQTGVGANACLFSVLGLPIKRRNFSTIVISTPPLCNGALGSIKVAAYDVEPQYKFDLFLGASLVSTSGQIAASDYTFGGLTAGSTYTVITTTIDGCTDTKTVTIPTVPGLAVNAAITTPLTPCSVGQITLTPTGGTPSYSYRLGNSGPYTAITTPFVASSAGNYTFNVIDANGCNGSVTVNMPLNPAPIVIVSSTNILCNGANNGTITFTTVNSNGYTLTYSINNGATYTSSNTFANLTPNTYQCIIKYTLNGVDCFTTVQNRVITQPQFVLTASGGVSAVACDANGGKGKIRITNPQGGTPPYDYNLGSGYQALNEASVFPGTYTISIRDSNQCVFIMNVILDPVANAPTIGVQTPAYNCNGTATTTIIVNNGPSNYSYTYSLDNVLNIPPTNNVFQNVACGPHNIAVNYQLTSVSTYSNLLFETFGSGPSAKSPGIAAAYCWNFQPFPPNVGCGYNNSATPPAGCPNNSYTIEDNQYNVTASINPNNCNWWTVKDHTSNGTDLNGRFLAVNIGDAAGNYGVLYSKQINDVIPNQAVKIDIYLTNMLRAGVGGVDPDFILELTTLSGIVVASQATGVIDNLVDGWVLKSLSLNPGSNTSLILNLRSGSIEYGGNDAAIDDINVYQLPSNCLSVRNFPVNVDCGKQFTAQVTSTKNINCFGGSDGQITISAQNFIAGQGFQYSVNGGLPIISFISPTVIPNLPAGTYTINVGFDATNACSVTLASQTLTAPPALIASATITTAATCSAGATITASATGGTPGYQYQLTNASGTTVVRPYQTGTTFTGVGAGTYLVNVRDVNGCIDPINAPITVVIPPSPTATIALTSNYCVTATAGATLVVSPTGGLPAYNYSLNGGSFGTNNTFTNLSPGNYVIVVRDRNNCTFTVATQTINPQLIVSASATKDLDCSSSPNAVINASITGGYPSYTYQVVYNAGAPSTAVSVTGSAFTYTTAVAGTYQFIIRDSRGCTVNSSIITITPRPNPTATATVTNISCTVASGTVTINAGSGTPPYSYSFNSSAFTNASTYSGLAAGTYNYVVRDSKQCLFNGTVTITQPSTVFSASAGVSELACDNNGGNGKVRITNPQNGLFPYQYNFGGGYQSLNEASLPPGTYTISIKDANGCVYTTSVTIDPIPPAPTITLGTPVYNCNGTSSSTVTVNAGVVNYNYSYFIDNVLNTNNPPNVFTNVSCGPHNINVKYQIANPPTFSQLLTETFGSGSYTTSPGINPAYCFENQSAIGFSSCNPDLFINDGEYAVTRVINPKFGVWIDGLDHTNPIGDPQGRFLCVNIGGSAGVGGILYSKPIIDIIPNQPVRVSLWAENLMKASEPTFGDPDLTIQLVYNLGLPSEVIVASQNTNSIPKSEKWENYLLTLNPGSYTSLSFVIRSNSTVINGNDVLIDDISVFQLPVICVNTKNFPLNIPCDKAFTAQITGFKNLTCNGVNNGEITIAAQNFKLPYGFDYSINGGSTWTNVQTSPVPLTNLPAGIQNVLVRFNNASNTCSVSLTQTLTVPPALVASAMVTQPVTCISNGIITASATGGSSPYSYQLQNGTGGVLVSYTNNPVFTNVPVGNYIVVVKDNNNCIDPINSSITLSSPASVSAILSATSDYCYDTTNQATLVVNATGGTPGYTYSLNGNPFVSTNSFPVTPGSQTIVVKDSFGCTFTLPVQNIAPQLTTNVLQTKTLDCTSSPDAVFTATISGGYPGYSYQVIYNGGTPSAPVSVTGTTFTYSSSAVGTYNFIITDSQGCTARSATSTINAITNPTGITVVNNATCGNNNGSFSITASGGTPGYTYSFNGSPTFTNTSTYSGLGVGVYTYQIRDSKSCIFSASVTITTPSAISATVAITIPYSCSSTGSIQAQNVSGGTSGYTYSINGTTFQSSNTFNSLTNGTYTITVRDASNCTFVTNSVTLGPLNPPTDLNLTSTAITCPANTSNVTLTTVGSNPPYSYQITAPVASATPYQATNVFNNLTPGTYTFQVKDAKDCTYQESYTINAITPISASGQLVGNVRCLGTATGNVRFTVSGFGSTYNYNINGNATVINQSTSTINLSNIAAGSYTITVTDNSTNCSASATVIVNSPSLPLSSTLTIAPITCDNSGSVTITSTGGWGGNSYILTPPSGPNVGPQTSNIFGGLSLVGNYSVSTTDSNGCIISNSFTLTSPASVSATLSATSDYCFDTLNQATLVVNATGGTPGYTYSINGNPFVNTNSFVVTPGNQTIVVKDSFGCTFTLPTQNIAPQLTTNVLQTKTLDCTSSPDAVFTATISGGYPGYSYQVIYNGGTPSAPVSVTGTTFTYSSSAVGTYNFIITDSQGCTARSATSTINAITNPTGITVVNNATCGNNNGSFSITASGGTPGYTYSFNGSPTFTNTSTYSGLGVGVYTYQIRDSKSCIFSASVTITTPSAISATVAITIPYSCSSTGSIQAQNVSGGTSGYTYSINGTTFQSSNTFNSLTNGTYTITVRDASNCTFVTNSVTLGPLNPPTDLNLTSTAITCPANTSNVTLTTVGSNPPYSYQITAPVASATPYQATNVFNNLTPGTYTFQVKDAKDCTYQESYTINAITPISASGQLVGNVRCLGTATGNVRFTVSGFGSTYNYNINGNATVINQSTSTINLSNIAAGSYTITVTDNSTNCSASATVIVNSPSLPLSSTLTIAPITCDNSGSVTITSTGGWGGNSYILTPPSGPNVGPQTSNIFGGLSLVGNYSVSTTDSNGCIISNSFTLTSPASVSATLSATSDYCFDTLNQATLVVNATGGTPGYTYSINGNPFVNTNSFVVTPGNQTIVVKDSFGCTFTLPTQNIAPQLVVASSIIKGLDCTISPNANIESVISGGYTPFTYVVSYNSGVPSLPALVSGTSFSYSASFAGTYVFTITDNRGCTTQSTVVISPLVNPEITTIVQTQQILCNGDASGAIQVNIDNTKGVGPFVITVLNTTSGFNFGQQTSGLTAGNYTVTVTDSKSCTDVRTNVIIGQPAQIVYAITKTDITCTGLGTTFGTISVTGLTGGTAPFTYILSNNIGQPNQTHNTATGADYTFTILNFGIYEMNVVDANGCTVKTQNIIMSSPPSDLTIDLSTPTATCAAGGTIVVTVSAFPPSPSYYFAIYQGSTLPTFPSGYQLGNPLSATFTGLNQGVVYSFVVYDPTTNCYYFKSATGPVPSLSNLTSTVDVVNNVSCNGSANGNVSFTFANYDASSVTYALYNSQSNVIIGASTTLTGLTGASVTINNVGPLPPGIYYVLFTENDGTFAGCKNASTIFTITQSAIPLAVSATTIKNDNCNLNAGQAAIIAQGGTSPYSYQFLLSSVIPPTASSLGWVNGNTFNVESGNYIAYVKDANGCIQSTATVVSLDPTPVITATATTQCTAGAGLFTIDVNLVTAGIPPYTYSLDGSTYQTQSGTSFTYSNIASGIHTVEVKDVNGCGNLVSLTIYPPLNSTLQVTTLPSCSNNDGVITVNAQGGSASYSYAIVPSAGITLTSNVFSNVPSGTYAINITDTLSGCIQSVSVTLNSATPVSYTTIVTDAGCNGLNTGSIQVNLPLTNDNPPYSYQLNSGLAQSSNLFTGLTAGSYTLTVTSSRGCSATSTVVVGEPTILIASATATAFSCGANNVQNNAIVTVTSAGGTAPYFYSTDGTNYVSTNTFAITNNNSTQTINVFVKDNNGCIATNNVTILALPTITLTAVTQTTAITCINDEIVSVSATGGSGNYSYQLLPSGAVQASSTFSLSSPGSYTFQINDLNTGCSTITSPYTVNPFNTINVVASQQVAVQCFGENNGAININVTGYSGAYTYTVSDGVITVATGTGNTTTNPQPITGLLAGNYTVTLTETASPFCIYTTNTVNVGTPSAPLSVSIVSNVNANCNTGAQVTVSGTGGTPSYTYAFVPTGVTPLPSAYSALATVNLNPLTNTVWNVYVKDNNGCISSATVTIATDPQPTVTNTTAANANCGSNGSSFDITVAGTGVGTLTYSIGGTFQATPNFTVTSPGTYVITVKDGNECIASTSVVVYAPINLIANITTLPSCSNNDGVITVNAQGGSASYSYAIVPSAGITLTSNVFSNVPSGTYAINITDTLSGCIQSVSVTLNSATPVSYTTIVTDAGCNGLNTGSIQVNLPLTNDNPPYSYQLNSGLAQSSNLFTGLTAGSYTLTVTSSRGCSATSTVVVGEPTILIASATATAFSCGANNVQNNAIVTVTSAGGTAPYFYSTDGTNYVSTNTFAITNNNSTQTINVFVKDNNGCIATNNVTILALPTITLTAVTQTTAITCINDEIVSVSATGGSGNYSYQLLPSGAVQASSTFSLSSPGSYTFQINDLNTGCSTITSPYTVNPFNTINVVASQQVAVQCFGENNGAININVTGYSGAYTYTVSDGVITVATGTGNTTTNPQPITGLLAGNYTVTLTETASPFCIYTTNTVNVGTPSAPLSVSIVSNVNANCNTGAQVTVSGTGGTPSYTYAFVPTGVTPLPSAYSALATVNLNPLTNTVWNVYVKDNNGCISSATVTIATDPQPTVTNTTAANANCGSNGSSFDITVAGTGVPPLSYNIGNGFQSGTLFTVSAPGNYFVEIKDGNGCTAQSATITIFPALAISASVTSLPTCVDGNGTIAVLAQGGSGNYQYRIGSGPYQPTGVFSNIFSGNYTVEILDVTTGCTKTLPIIISIATPVTLQAPTVVNVVCNGETNGSIEVNLTPTSVGVNDNPDYLYAITAGPIIRANQLSNTFTDLPAGTYTIVVTSGRACVASQTNIVITQPNAIVVATPTVTQFACNANSNSPNFATITLTSVTGGSGVYTLYEFVKNGTIVQTGLSTSFVDAAFGGGNYVINVYDDKGCSGSTSATVTINPFIEISNPIVSVTTPITCTSFQAIKVTVTASGGTPLLNYNVVGLNGSTYNQTNTTGDFNNIAVGDYEVTVTNTVTGCSVKTFHIVDSPNTFNLNAVSPTSVICYGSNEGSISLSIVDLQTSPTNDAGAFDYVITGPTSSTGTTTNAGPFTVSGLLAGVYEVTATLKNTPFCSVTSGFTIQQPASPLIVVPTQTASVTCDNNLGVIFAPATGGWTGGYLYALSGAANVGYSTNNIFTGLAAGNYVVTVKDSVGCEVSASITLSVPTPINATIVLNTPLLACNGGSNGSISAINVTGGEGSGYNYTLNALSISPPTKSGPSPVNTFTNLSAGTYSIDIVDGFNCKFTTATVVINEPAKVKAVLVTQNTQTCLNQAQLTLTASGGTPPFTYSNDGLNYSSVTFNPSITFAVPVGSFSYYIKDANGCVSDVSNQVVNAQIPTLTATYTAANAFVNCFGDNTGSIVANAQGGLGNYQYVLVNNTTGVTSAAQPSGSFNGLTAGNYTLNVFSGDCSFSSLPIVINQPSAALSFVPTKIDVSCFGAGNGQITITAAGGTAPYIYAISPNLNSFTTVNTYANLVPGNYDMIIQDANGCKLPYSFTIIEPTGLLGSLDQILTQELCFGDKSASFVISVSGGTQPYSYSVDNPNGPFVVGTPTQTQFTITGQTGGNHFVYVKDKNGCDAERIPVVLNLPVNIQPVVTPNTFCPDETVYNNVVVTVNPAVQGQVQFSLDGGAYQSNNIFENLTPGAHYITVQHTNGCTTPLQNFNVVVVEPLTLNLIEGGLNEIVAMTSGGNGGYTYTLNGVSYGTSNNFIINASGDYTVVVTDAKGCTITATIPIIFIDIFIPNVFTPNNDGTNDVWLPVNTQNYKNLIYYVFDRYGRKLATRKEGESWDGRYNDAEMPSGDYWYMIKTEGESGSGREFIGNFTLYR
jgi:large repetitive protein